MEITGARLQKLAKYHLCIYATGTLVWCQNNREEVTAYLATLSTAMRCSPKPEDGQKGEEEHNGWIETA
jgi:hypothetical protein